MIAMKPNLYSWLFERISKHDVKSFLAKIREEANEAERKRLEDLEQSFKADIKKMPPVSQTMDPIEGDNTKMQLNNYVSNSSLRQQTLDMRDSELDNPLRRLATSSEEENPYSE